MMFRPRGSVWRLALLMAGMAVSTAPAAGQTAAQTAAGAPRAVLDKYCTSCHSQRTRIAGLALDTVDLSNVGANGEVWERVLRKLRGGMMPPSGSPRPDQPTYDAVSSWLEAQLDRAAAASPRPGRKESVHRLNRAEYQNAVRDLLGVDIDAASLLPVDDAGQHGFDNIADVLSVSPTLLTRYMSAARKVSRLAVGLLDAPATETHSASQTLVQDDRLSEDQPFGSRGGVSVPYNFPVDGDYVVKVRLQKNYSDYIRGLGEPHHLDVRVDGARIKRFTVGGDAPGRPAPSSWATNIFGSQDWEEYALRADEQLDVRFTAQAGPRVISVSFAREVIEPEGVQQPRKSGFILTSDEMYYGNPAVESVEIGGPYRVEGPGDTPSRRRVFVCRPRRTDDEDACAGRILSGLARRAYRRPVTQDDVATLIEFYRAGRADGFDAGIQFAIERILAAPDFLFRIERDPANTAAGTAYRVGDLDLASRLSFFLWSSIPDETLLDLAVRGRLKDPAVLEKQVRRMLADPKSTALVANFGGQWLELRNIGGLTPDPGIFADFDENLRHAFQEESRLFLESQFREDRSLLDLLTADYTFVNERLARHYGIPGVYGERFRRVALTDARRRGLLGQGGVLAVTSYPDRTSPVLRGKWLLGNLLGTPPPPPPPDVPALPARADGGRPASVRERLEQHRRNPVCATCHSQMDPLGFALEPFDGIGGWREIGEGGDPIDASGSLPSGVKFTGPAGLRAFLMDRREQFTGTVTEKLLAYALGRPVDHDDMPAVRKIVRGAGPDMRWSSIVLGIVKSVPFQMRRTADSTDSTEVRP